MIDVSIIVLTWQPNEDLVRCLSVFRRSDMSSPREIILIDNASKNPQVDLLAKDPLIKIIRNRRNNGVARARNQALRIARGTYYFFLDADTEPDPTVMPALIAILENNPTVGIAAPALRAEDGAILQSCRRFPTVLSKIARRLPPGLARKVLDAELYDSWRREKPCPVDYVLGACQAIRASAVQTIGLLDEKIFYGPEDVDFCLRMWQAGYVVVFDPRVSVIHCEQRYTARHPLSLLSIRHAQGLFHYFCKHRYMLTRPVFRSQSLFSLKD